MEKYTSERYGENMGRAFTSNWRCPVPKCRQKAVVDWNGNEAGDIGKKWPFCERHGGPMIMTSNSIDGTLDIYEYEHEKQI